MTIDKIHNYILFLIDKAQGSYYSHEEIDQALDSAQMTHFMDFFGNPKDYQPGKYVPRISLGVSQKINDALSPFKEAYSATSDSTGILTLPDDYLHLLSLNTIQNIDSVNYSRAVEVVNEDEVIERLNSQVCPVSLTGPIAIKNSGKQIQLFPQSAQAAKGYYLRRPAVPEFVYIQSGRTVTYDSANSTQLEWDDTNINHIVVKATAILGINLQAGEVVNIMEAKDQKGV